jgi:glucans biosynthesis protein
VKSVAVPAEPGPYLLSPGRREVLRLIGASVAGAVLGHAPAQAQNPSALAVIQNALGDGQRFDPAVVADLARQIARRPYVAVPPDLPEPFGNLTAEQYGAIKAQPSTLLWAGENRGIVVEPLHRGSFYTNAVALFAVEDGQVRRLVYDRNRFAYGRLNVPPTVGDIGFSGVRLYSGSNGQLADFASVQGATFFRARARGQDYGAVARGLTLRPAEARGEEFPVFRAMWLERPAAGAGALVMHAIIESESVAGALRMTWRPGEMAIVDVEQTLFPRVDLDHLGIGGMGASYLFGPNDRRTADDVRPAVYEAAGLQMLNGQGEWLWRPLHNPERLQISAFIDRNPRGFGLIQRDRDFTAFQDDVEHWERRPTLWVEPLGEWGDGVVQLIEIPSDAEANDNILAYWRPKGPVPAGSELTLAYRQFWCWTMPERPALAAVAVTRVGKGSTGRRRRFIVDFSGDVPDASAGELKPMLTTSPGAIQALKLWRYPERKTTRVTFELDPGNENACEMRLVLEAGGKPSSETWLYRWTP